MLPLIYITVCSTTSPAVTRLSRSADATCMRRWEGMASVVDGRRSVAAS